MTTVNLYCWPIFGWPNARKCWLEMLLSTALVKHDDNKPVALDAGDAHSTQFNCPCFAYVHGLNGKAIRINLFANQLQCSVDS